MKRLPNENKYQLDIKDQFKNEFEIGQLQGNNFHMTDSADLPMLIEPQGNIEQVVVEEIPGNTIEGEIINITNGDSTKEVKAIVHGNSYQETIAEEVGTTVVNKSIHLTDVNTAKESSLLPNGGIEQDSRVGYNLVNEDSLSVFSYYAGNVESLNGNLLKTIALNEGSTPSNVGVVFDSFPYEVGEYYVSTDIRLVSGTGTYSNLQITREGTNETTTLDVSNPKVNNNFQRYVKKYTVSSADTTAKAIRINVQFKETTNAVFEITNFQISKVNNDYEQYGAMPSRYFPSEVKGVSGHYDTVVENNNIYNANIGFENGYLNSNDGTVIKGSGWKVSDYIKIPENVKTITLLNGWGQGEVHCFYDENKKFVSFKGIGSSMTNTKIALTDKCKYARFTVNYTYKEDYMIAFGDTDTFIEHQEQLLPIDIPTGQVWYSGKPYKVGNKWYRDDEYLKVVLDGTETITVSNAGTENWYYNFNFANNTKFPTGVQNSAGNAIFSNMYKVGDVVNANSVPGIAIYTTTIRIREEVEDTAANFKARLAELYTNGTPLYFVYKLANPQRIEITDETLIEQLEALQNAEFYDGVTNINSYRSSEDVAEMPLEAHYNFITPSPSVERLSDIEEIDTVNKVDITAKTQTLNGLTLTIKEDKSFTVTGTLLANKNANFTLGKIDYIPYFDQEMTLDIGYIPLSKNIGAMVSHAQDNNGNRIVTNFWNIDNNNNNTGYATITKKIENYDTSNGFNVLFTLYFPVVTEDTPVNISGHLQLNKGGHKPYLPYGHIGLLQTGKQLLNLPEFTETKNGITLTYNKGVVTLKGKATATQSTFFTSKKVANVKIGKSYYFNRDIQNINGDFKIFLGAKIGAFNTEPAFTTTLNSKIFDVSGDVYFMPYFSTIQAGTEVDLTFRPQLEYGDKATEFEEYKENLIPINLNGNTLAKIDDTVRDLLNIRLDGNVSITKKSKEYVFTGYETFFNNQNAIGLKYFNNQEKFKDNGYFRVGYMNYFKSAINGLWDIQEKEDLFTFASSELNRLAIMSKNHNTIEEFKAWLKELYDNGTPVKILYGLAKDYVYTINLPSIEPIKLFEGTNNFELVTNLDTTINMTYNHVGYSPSIVKPSEVKSVGSEEHINLLNVHNLLAPAINVGISVDNKGYISSSKTTDTRQHTYANSNWQETLESGIYSILVEKVKATTNTNLALRVIKNDSANTVLASMGPDKLSNNAYVQSLELTETTDIGITFKVYDGIYRVCILKGKYSVSGLSSYYIPYNYCRYDNVVGNKNLIKLDKSYSKLAYYGIDLTIQEDGGIKVKGTATANVNIVFPLLSNIKIKNNTFTFSGKAENIENNKMSIRLLEGSGVSDKNSFGNTYVTLKPNIIASLKATITDEKNYSHMLVFINSGYTVDTVIYTQLEVGDTATSYIEHQSQSLPIDLPIGMKMYNDEFFYKENGKWYRKIEWKKKVFNGTENWTYYEPTKVFFDYDIVSDSKKANTYPYCNYLKGGGYGNKSGTIMINSAQRVHISLWNFTTVNELKSWLQELYANGTPVYMVYELAEPYPEEITDANLIAQLEKTLTPFSYYPVTNINSYKPTTSVADLKLYVEYFKSNKITNK